MMTPWNLLVVNWKTNNYVINHTVVKGEEHVKIFSPLKSNVMHLYVDKKFKYMAVVYEYSDYWNMSFPVSCHVVTSCISALCMYVESVAVN